MKMHRTSSGFTLIEMLVATAVIALILVMLASMADQTQRLVRSTSGKVEQFQEARVAFESMTRRLSQATLSTYWDYAYRTEYQTVAGRQTAVRVPDRYQRASELRFRSGPMAELTRGRGPNGAHQPMHGIFFQAPNGFVADPARYGSLDHLLNSWGYFIESGTDEEMMPPCVRGRVEPRKRFRLMEFMEPAEKLSVYKFQGARATEWFAPAITAENRPVRVLAENVLALVIMPRFDRTTEESRRASGKPTNLAPGYRYDTTATAVDPELNPKNQLPPVVQVTMVAIDETSARKLNDVNRNHPTGGIEFGQLFRKPESYDSDLASLEQQLTTVHQVAYRVFTTNVSIRGAKWSITQQN
jgi:uncharacterized protein (TIGR02599 family)